MEFSRGLTQQEIDDEWKARKNAFLPVALEQDEEDTTCSKPCCRDPRDYTGRAGQ